MHTGFRPFVPVRKFPQKTLIIFFNNICHPQAEHSGAAVPPSLLTRTRYSSQKSNSLFFPIFFGGGG
jgi:hypothetical protein